MSTDSDPPGRFDESNPGEEARGSEAVERIADPDNYNLRRRLKQLHDARETVREVKTTALFRSESKKEKYKHFGARERDLHVVDAVVDYILELLAVLKHQEDLREEFLEETITVGQTTISIEEIVRTHGHPDRNQSPSVTRGASTTGLTDLRKLHELSTQGRSSSAPLNYRYSMHVWRICNDYFEDVAGPEFERDGLPNAHLDEHNQSPAARRRQD